MTDQTSSGLLGLRREYLSAMPNRLEELREDIDALKEGSHDAVLSLRGRLHRLAGSGGSYGFSELSAIAREGERWLAAYASSKETALSLIHI